MQNEQQKQMNDTNPIARHNARRYALQALYQWQLNATPMADIESEFKRFHIEKKVDDDYFKGLIHGVNKHQELIDNVIKEFINRSLREIDPVELAVLRIATYEILKRPDIPYRVVINEALELTKKFGSIEGHKFVNGVLDKIAKKHRDVEVNMKK